MGTAMRLIDADLLKRELVQDYAYAAASMVDAQPTVDAVPVVRCKDCEYSAKYNSALDFVYCNNISRIVPTEFYCADGERKFATESEETK